MDVYIPLFLLCLVLFTPLPSSLCFATRRDLKVARVWLAWAVLTALRWVPLHFLSQSITTIIACPSVSSQSIWWKVLSRPNRCHCVLLATVASTCPCHYCGLDLDPHTWTLKSADAFCNRLDPQISLSGSPWEGGSSRRERGGCKCLTV